MEKYKNNKYWNEFYKNKTINEESRFSRIVKEYIKRDKNSYQVIDIGCGLGRDSLYFRKNGYNVYGIDGSEVAIEYLSTYEEDGLKFSCRNLEDKDIFKSIVNPRKDGNLVFYMRFLLHSVTEDVEDNIIDSIGQASNFGDLIALEFRTLEDENYNKVYKDHYRRFIDENNLIKKLKKIGYRKEIFIEKGQGLSPYKDEDPFLCRLILMKD